MKKAYIFLLHILICVGGAYGQTGINTEAPQQQLHIAGTTSNTPIGSSGISVVKPTIRIDGLNNTNNSALYTASPSLLQAVSATQSGDLLLTSEYAIPLAVTALGTDEITAPLTLTTPPVTNPPGNNTSITIDGVLKTYTFTLKQKSMVHFLASVSVSAYRTGTTTLIVDGVPRAYHVHFRFSNTPAGSGINTGSQFGTDGNSYSNGTSGGSTGDMYAVPESYLILPAGTYTVQLVARLFGNDYDFTGVIGSGTADMVSIIATPL